MKKLLLLFILMINFLGLSIYAKMFVDTFDSTKMNKNWIIIKSEKATTNDKIYIQNNHLFMETGVKGLGYWDRTTINLRYNDVIKNDNYNLKFKLYLKDFDSGFRAGPGGEFYVDFYVPQYMEIWTLIFQWGVPKNGLPPNPEKKASMAFMSYNNDKDWLNPNADVFSYVGFGKKYLYLPTNKWLNVRIKNTQENAVVQIDDGKKQYRFVRVGKRKKIKKFPHSSELPGGYLQFRLNKARSHVICMLDDISLNYQQGETDSIDKFIKNKKEELDKAFLKDKDLVNISSAQGITIGGDMGFDFNPPSKIFEGKELFGNPTRLVPLGSYRYMIHLFAKERLGNTFIVTSIPTNVQSDFLSDLSYIGSKVGFWSPVKYSQLVKIMGEDHIAFADEGGEWSSYLSRGTGVVGDSMKTSRENYINNLKKSALKALNSDIPADKITHEETSAIINDFFNFGFKQMTYEKVWWNYAPVFMSLMRPASINSGVNEWGVWHAYCQYNIMNPEKNGDDPWEPNLKAKLNWFKLALLYGYIGGGNYFYTENGLSSFWAVMGNTWLYGLYDYHTRKIREIQKNFYHFAQQDKRPDGFPDRTLAFIKGANDSWRGDFLVYEAWNGSKRHCWNNEKYPYDTPETSWRSLLNFMPIKGNPTNDMDVFNGSIYGPLDIIDSSVKEDVYSLYDQLMLVGWNNMDDTMYQKLIKYVKQGGQLFIGIPQFIKNEKGDREKAVSLTYTIRDLYKNGNFSDLAGIKIKNKGNSLEKIIGKEKEYLIKNKEIIGSEIDIVDKNNTQILFSDQNNKPIMIKHKLGKGSVEMLLTWNYIGEKAMSSFVNDYMKEKAKKMQETLPIYVTEKGKKTIGQLDKYIAISAYSKEGIVYILNVDDTRSHKIDIHFKDGSKQSKTIHPSELFRVNYKTKKIFDSDI